MLELLGKLTDLLSDTLYSPWLWVIVFLVAGLDALLPFMPSETTVMTVAVLLGPDLAMLGLLVVVGAGGAFAGDCLGHWIGRKAGPRTLARLQRNEKGRQRYEWARQKVHKHGTVLIVAGRYLPGGRVASALATGSLRFPFRRFAILDAIGVTVWAAYSVAVGFLGASQFADDPAKGLLFAFAIGLLAVGCGEVARRLVARRARHGGSGVPDPRVSAVDGGETDQAPRRNAVVGGHGPER
ncbi:hypothetical protein BAY61_01835 [Prauserella marina]|uniref:Membrane protein DedA, SNARE-associated domain n=1 Tax=Prauserella marina TaxID=530584 RepID=A0A222VJD6_9PSEU|nr:DedA family protein [Prauserella marina]ASR33942.1 hypothetical protein BAY61_01835 [Prauserella marina]PWV82542.1 membrane protein DedA with SNARE-associated domain [Prauserella marina]SDC71623.1 membrane protein DedA, SNARE-associated domain [Prauserella marina]